MNIEYGDDLMEEFGGIVTKYGPERVTALAERIRDPQWANDLASLLEQAVMEYSLLDYTPKSQSNGQVGKKVLEAVKFSDPEKYSVLKVIRRDLTTGTTLQAMADLRHFARLNGISLGNTSSRKAAIPVFLRSLTERPTCDLIVLQDSIREFDPRNRSLENWRKVIVKQYPSVKQK